MTDRQPEPTTEARFPKVHKFDPIPNDPERCMKCGFLWSSIVHIKQAASVDRWWKPI